MLYIDGEMPLADLQERLSAISISISAENQNGGFQILAADQTESGINLVSPAVQQEIDPLLKNIDLLVLDNLSTLCTTGSESASDAWVPMQNWLLRLRRQGVAVLLIHHAGTNGRQRGTSRREDALDTVIALRRPEDYLPEQGARFEIHFEKLRQRVGDAGSASEATAQSFMDEGRPGLRWISRELKPDALKRATELFEAGQSVRQVAAVLGISKSEAGRLRQSIDAGRQDISGSESVPTLSQCPQH